MKKRFYARIGAAALVALSLLCVNGARAQATTYAFVDLGPIGPGAPHSINGSGQIAGTVNLDGKPRAFRITPQNGVWNTDPGGGPNPLMEILPIPSNRSQSRGKGINANGQVGGSVVGSGSNTVLWEANGAVKEFGPNSSYADAINGLGDLAGTASGRSTTAYLWRKDPKGYKAVSLGVLPGFDQSYAYGINDSRQVVGVVASGTSGARRAFLWSAASGMSVLPAPAGHNGNNWRANAINAQGVVAGYSIHDGVEHPVLWTNGAAQDLLPGSSFAAAALAAVNSAPMTAAVGSALWNLNIPRQPVAVLWNGTRLVDLNDLLVTSGIPAGAVLTEAVGINDSGQIVGTYSLDGSQRAFLLVR